MATEPQSWRSVSVARRRCYCASAPFWSLPRQTPQGREACLWCRWQACSSSQHRRVSFRQSKVCPLRHAPTPCTHSMHPSSGHSRSMRLGYKSQDSALPACTFPTGPLIPLDGLCPPCSPHAPISVTHPYLQQGAGCTKTKQIPRCTICKKQNKTGFLFHSVTLRRTQT